MNRAATRAPRTLGWGVAILLAALVGLAFAEQPVPPFAAFVTDLTGTLNPSQREALERELLANPDPMSPMSTAHSGKMSLTTR